MNGPMSGVKIVDLAAHISGPFGTTMLAEQGADVVKVEPIGDGDGMRYMRPMRNGVSAMFAAVNRNKRSLALDLRKTEGKAVLEDLLRGADVLVQNFRPGVIERLGFSYERVREINPSIIFVSINGFGADGPYADRRAYDGIVQASVGIPTMQAEYTTGEPRLIQTGICDKLTAVVLAQAIASALYGRSQRSDGAGQHIELPMMDTALWFLWPDGMCNHVFVGDDAPEPSEMVEHFKLRKTKDGYLMIALATQAEFVALCGALDRPDIADDPRFNTREARSAHLKETNVALAEAFATFDTDEAYERLLAADIPVSRVLDHEGLLTDPHIKARRLIAEDAHPVGGTMRRARHPIRFEDVDTQNVRSAPRLGEHTREILAQLRYSPAKIDELLAARIVGAARD